MTPTPEDQAATIAELRATIERQRKRAAAVEHTAGENAKELERYDERLESAEARATAAETDLVDIREENAKIQADNEGLHTQLRDAEFREATLSAQNAALRKAATAVLYHDERGQGVGYAEAMANLAKLVSLPAPEPASDEPTGAMRAARAVMGEPEGG